MHVRTHRPRFTLPRRATTVVLGATLALSSIVVAAGPAGVGLVDVTAAARAIR